MACNHTKEERIFATLKDILRENWEWRKQIPYLAFTDLQKQERGAVLGWAWLFFAPLMRLAVYWFALHLGLKATTNSDIPYLLWLSAGIMPWFYINAMLGAGSNVYRRYPFLVNRINFPISVIANFYSLSSFIVYAILMAGTVAVTALTNTTLTLYALQIIPLSLLMYAFFTILSILLSPLSAISRDFANVIKLAVMPLFWLSGIIFDVNSLSATWLQVILAFNPVTFFVRGMRAALCEHYWLWERPEILFPMVVVFIVTTLAALATHKRLGKDVGDVL